MAATLALPELDVDVLGPLLVAEVEAYLRSQPLPPARQARPRLTVPHVPRYGSVVQQWDHDVAKGHVTVKQFLNLMNRYIHQYGWVQGLLWDRQGQVCLLGARIKVLAAGYGTPAIDEQARLLIGNELGYMRQGMPLDSWNDQDGRSVHEIHDLLRRAAARA